MNEQVVQTGRSLRFDVFKGVADSTGRIHKLRNAGFGSQIEGHTNYVVGLNAFLKDRFFLMPEDKNRSDADFVIFTRQPTSNPKRKYSWYKVGEARLLPGENSELLQLQWDVLGVNDIYMTTTPRSLEGAQA